MTRAPGKGWAVVREKARMAAQHRKALKAEHCWLELIQSLGWRPQGAMEGAGARGGELALQRPSGVCLNVVQ